MQLTLRIILGLILVTAGVQKSLHPVAFLAQLQAYALPLPQGFLRLIGACFPWLEGICGVALVFNWWSESTRLLVVLLFAGFSMVLAQAVVRGLTLDCGCFGTLLPQWLERPPIALIRALLLLAASLYLFVRRETVREGK